MPYLEDHMDAAPELDSLLQAEAHMTYAINEASKAGADGEYVDYLNSINDRIINIISNIKRALDT